MTSKAYSLAILASITLLSDCSPHGPLTTDAAHHFEDAYASWPIVPWRVPDANSLPSGAEGTAVRAGIALLTHTSELAGPRAINPGRRVAFNNLQCVQCHKAGPSGLPGTAPYALPLVNAFNDYPKLETKTMEVITLEQRIVGMFGQGAVALTPDSPQVHDIVAYLRWLAEATPSHHHMQGTGLPNLAFPQRAASVERGAQSYATRCSMCHGRQGLGVAGADFSTGGGYAVPPIAGDDAYDDSGHMARVPLLTRYLVATMPPGASAEAPLLGVDEAYDIAAYVTVALPRRRNPLRAHAYPDPLLRPDGVAIPELWPSPQALQRATLGPFSHPNR